MSRHNNSIGENVKNIIILLLIISAMLLGWVSRLFGNEPVKADSITALWKSISGAPAEDTGIEEKIQAAALPVTAAVTDGNGGRYGTKYSLKEISDLYSQTVTIFNQALGTALTPTETTPADWRSALSSLGVYYEYLTPVSLTVLAGWYDADIAVDWGAIAVRRLCVTYSDGRNHLYFQDDATGKFYVSGTADLKDISGFPLIFGKNSARFAFEIREGSAAPYTLLMPDVTEHPVFTVKNPLIVDQTLAEVLLHLEVNENATPSYTEPDGTEVFVVSNFNLRLARDGTIVYHRTGTDGDSAGGTLSESEAIMLA